MPAGITQTQDIANFLVANLRQVFMKNLETPRYTAYDKITVPWPSQKNFEKYDSVGNLKSADVTPESNPINYGKIDEAYQTTIYNLKITNGLKVSLESYEDDLYGVVAKAKSAELARTATNKKERIVANIYNNAFTNTGADGVANIANNHPLKDCSQVNSNLITGALTPGNLIAGLNLFNHFLNHAGEIFDTEPTKLITHKDKMSAVLEILDSQLKAYELSNTKNVVDQLVPVLKPVFSKYFTINTSTGVAPWFLVDEVVCKDGCGPILQTRKGQTFRGVLDERDTLDFYFNFDERYNAGMVSVGGFGIAGSQG